MGWRAGRTGPRRRRLSDASYTHMQRAEPVLVAHWLLAYVEMALRDAGDSAIVPRG